MPIGEMKVEHLIFGTLANNDRVGLGRIVDHHGRRRFGGLCGFRHDVSYAGAFSGGHFNMHRHGCCNRAYGLPPSDSRPAGLNVFRSKKRTSSPFGVSIVSASRSSFMALDTTRAPFGQGASTSGAACDLPSPLKTR